MNRIYSNPKMTKLPMLSFKTPVVPPMQVRHLHHTSDYTHSASIFPQKPKASPVLNTG